jgi:predicted metalloendopeptidase
MTKTKKNNKQLYPQSDFYEYVNNDWINSHQDQTTKHPYITNFKLLSDKIDHELKQLVMNKLIKNNKNINNLFNSFVHNDNSIITNYIYLLINEVRDIFKLDFQLFLKILMLIWNLLNLMKNYYVLSFYAFTLITLNR